MSGIFGNESTSLTKGFENRYGYAISQRVFRHIPHKAKRDDLVCDPYNLTDFIISILRSTGCTKEMLADAAAQSGRSAREQADEFVKTSRPSSIIQRAADVEEVANLAVYLASPLSSATTGAALRVDGGVVDTLTM